MDPLTLTELSPQMKEMAELLVFGLDSDHAGLGIIAGKPLTAEETAEVLGVRRKFVRRMQQAPVFNAYVSSLLAALRRGEHARSIHTMVEIRDAQDAKHSDRLTAAKAILGEESKGVSVNIQNNNTQRVGYVIVPWSPEKPATIIEGKAE